MIAFFILLRNMYHVLKILFRQDEQKAVMFSVVFLLTVGYGDIHPVTPIGKIFTICYVLLGIGVISALIVNFNRALKEFHSKQDQSKRK